VMRTKPQKTARYFLPGVLILLFFLAGCGKDNGGNSDPDLVQVRDRVLSVNDFISDFETIKNAYDENTFKDKTILNNVRLRLLDQKIEELILLERAEDLNIDISEETLNKEVSRIKSGFPEGVFEQVLLEYAVSYNQWKGRLKNRLIMEEVITADLRDQIEISPEDMESYYHKIYEKQAKDVKPETNVGNPTENAITFLRQQKKEQVYQAMIKRLREQYHVKVNKMEWNRICSANPG